ncbi:MAG: HEAT repeat domain-containing protein [Chitinophagaceae bacterium]|nr:HEAT repeat domain-containing protein [Chitinophagaceae bacterium]
MNSEFEKFIQENRKAFENREPDPAVLERITEQMRGMKKKPGILIPLQTLRWAAACLVLIACGATFWIMQKGPAEKTKETAGVIKPAVKTPVAEPTQPANREETVANPVTVQKDPVLRRKPQNSNTAPEESSLDKQALFAKLNDMASPSKRLSAASEASSLIDRDIIDALVKTMNTDPNTNVRLAALESLSRFHRESYVRKQLVAALEKQKDPVVQIELIQLLTRMKETSILKQLDKITQDDNAIKAVKDNAYSGIFTLRS